MCGIVGIINTDRQVMDGSHIREAIRIQRDRGNGLGGGFAVYGAYPDNKNQYAFHIMYEGDRHNPVIPMVEDLLRNKTKIYQAEQIPVFPNDRIPQGPYFKRYFLKPIADFFHPDETEEDYIVRLVMEINRIEGTFVISSGKNMGVFKGVGYPEDIADFFHPDEREEDYIVRLVMEINRIEGAFVISSGKNMGVFKGVGYPEDIADYFGIEDYEGYMWVAHNRFPTNTPGWWGGAHPFTILDKGVVHNGEITSYGTNLRWLEMYGYYCLLQTDTEVISYIFDKLFRKDRLSKADACSVMAPSLWEEIDRTKNEKMRYLRQIYGSAIVNGPFGIVLTHNDGAIVLNDRNKLRPVVCARAGNRYYSSSEECSIRLLSPDVDEIWSPRGGEPVIIDLDEEVAA